MAPSSKKNVIMIDPGDAVNMGIIKDHTSEVFIDNEMVKVIWPDKSKINHFLSTQALKKDLILKTFNDPTAKKYYKTISNKYYNFRRIIDLEIISCGKTTNNVKLNSLKKQDTTYKSNYILKSDKTISNLKQKHINEEFNNFFSNNNKQVNQIKNSDVVSAGEIEEFFDMNQIRKLSLDYNILGDRFLKLFEIAPSDQLPILFKEVENKLVGLDNEPFVEVFYTN